MATPQHPPPSQTDPPPHNPDNHNQQPPHPHSNTPPNPRHTTTTHPPTTNPANHNPPTQTTTTTQPTNPGDNHHAPPTTHHPDRQPTQPLPNHPAPTNNTPPPNNTDTTTPQPHQTTRQQTRQATTPTPTMKHRTPTDNDRPWGGPPTRESGARRGLHLFYLPNIFERPTLRIPLASGAFIRCFFIGAVGCVSWMVVGVFVVDRRRQNGSRWRKIRSRLRRMFPEGPCGMPVCKASSRWIDPALESPHPLSWSADHVEPVWRRPDLEYVYENLRPAHRVCNQSAQPSKRSASVDW